MTEAEWFTATDPASMLEFLWSKASESKVRFFACACCRRIWDLFTDDRSRKAVDEVEMYVDGLVNEKELTIAAGGA